MILDEVDKIPAQVATSRGNNLPGAFEVLKSMIEPATARGWVCPFCQIPFDLTGMSWVMTTNSIERMPAAFLDRCKLIRLEPPSTVALTAGNGLLCTMLPEDACNLGGGVLEKKHFRISLPHVRYWRMKWAMTRSKIVCAKISAPRLRPFSTRNWTRFWGAVVMIVALTSLRGYRNGHPLPAGRMEYSP